MRVAYVLIILCIILAVASVYIFFPKPKESGKATQTTTTSTVPGIEKGKVFVPVETKAGKNEILIFADRFEPSTLEVSLGEEFKWTNKDAKDHTIVLSNPPIEKRILAGSSFTFSFSTAGRVEFTDKETGMKGTIIVS